MSLLSAEYFAALRRISRSSRSLAFSFSNCRMRSESFAAWALSCTAFVRERLPVPYFLTHECSETRLTPGSADAVSSESSSLFSYRATASRLNSSEYLGMVVDYLSSQPDGVGYQVSTKQGSGPPSSFYEVLQISTSYQESRTIWQLSSGARRKVSLSAA